MDYENEKDVEKDLEFLKETYKKYSYDADIMEEAFNSTFFKYVDKIKFFAGGMDVISVFDNKVNMAEAVRNNVALIIKRLEIYITSGFDENCLQEFYLREGFKGEAINITFGEARKIFYENRELSVSDRNEIEQMVDLVEEVYSSVDTKKNKWHRLRPVIMWVSGKDVETGLLFLSLIQKIN